MKNKLGLASKRLCRVAIIALTAVIGFSFASCSNGSTDSGGGGAGPQETVYVAGCYDNGTTNIACYWKNGVKTDLSTVSSYAFDIVIITE